MTRKPIIEMVEKNQLKEDIPTFRIGDTLRVHTRIIEGQKERTQLFTGTVIARKGKGLSSTVTLHRVAYGTGMQRIFLIHSPRLAKIERMKEGDVRRAKLYYLRGTSGKKAKVREKITRRTTSNNKNSGAPAETATVIESATPETETKQES